jgi:microcystin-dependent protein
MFAGNFAPAGWALCQGQALPISENDILFTLIGTTYGGDGQSTFNLPNLASRVPVHMGTGGGSTYQIGESAGTEQETLSIQQIPVHSHPMVCANVVSNDPNPGNNLVGESSAITLYQSGNPVTTMAPGAITQIGGSQPHENCQPFLCINFIISLFGVYPTQT